MESLGNWRRTYYCGTLAKEQLDQEVTLTGWVQRRRDHGGVIFIDLRDRTGMVQIAFDPNRNAAAYEKAHSLRSEFVIAVQGKVTSRPEGTVNPKLPTGEIEISAHGLKILNEAKTPPFPIEDDAEVSEDVRLKYRFLDLRRLSSQNKLYLRHQVCQLVRRFLDEHGFLEVETPMLTRSTPEGARDYLVPSRVSPGMFYALPQSPQLFKQILMVSGFDRYFQIVRCFRDEDLRADRQPEFTQIDLEMSFIDRDDIIALMEQMIALIWKETKGVELTLPFPRLGYKDAMERYGSDKPDIRFGMEIRDLSDLAAQSEFKVMASALANQGTVRGICVPLAATFSRKDMDDLTTFAQGWGAKGLAWIKHDYPKDGEGCGDGSGFGGGSGSGAGSISGCGDGSGAGSGAGDIFGRGDGSGNFVSPIRKFFTDEILTAMAKRLESKPGDLWLMVADKPKVAFEALGQLRLHLAHRLGLIDQSQFKFLWVTDFPLLEYNDEQKRYQAMHHPFTAPLDEDLPLLSEHPEQVRAKAYDIVLNGSEIGGGSIRIHHRQTQMQMFEAIGMNVDEAQAKFGFLMEAFEYGAPPHGGIAFGLDRLIAILSGAQSIREVIAFPKTQKAVCPMTGAPDHVDPQQLKELRIKVI